MSEAEPRVSADGKFYWDGQRWAPIQATPAPTPTPKRGFAGRGCVVALLALGVLIAGGVLLAGVTGGGSHALTGTMTVHETVVAGSGDCTGTGGYDDIQAGTQVTVRDGSGKLLATGLLGSGFVNSGACVFAFSIDKVPDADFYQVEVSHRGAVTYSKSDMTANGWKVAVELGT